MFDSEYFYRYRITDDLNLSKIWHSTVWKIFKFICVECVCVYCIHSGEIWIKRGQEKPGTVQKHKKNIKKLNKNRNKMAARDMEILEGERLRAACYEIKRETVQKLFIYVHEHATSLAFEIHS